MNKTIETVTQRVIERSAITRNQYQEQMKRMQDLGPGRQALSCGNLAHGFAACNSSDKQVIRMMDAANVGIVTAYNDMLSAHQPYQAYPQIIKKALQNVGSTGQVAGATPAMCDGVTQGQPGMELSLFSRDQIAMSTAIALSHNMFDAALLLGICDKIVPGLLIGALRFGHIPISFVPAGPMPSGIPNDEKAKIRKQYAAGKVDREALLEAESKSYHSPGTCTFYGTANSNQLVLEMMGLQLPGASFVNPDLPLRQALTEYAAKRITRITAKTSSFTPLYKIVTEKSLINGIVSLLATGGSTNLTIHLIAVARAAGITIDWNDFAELSSVTPLLARIYPNGVADVNHFQAAGGTALLCSTLLKAGLLHSDVITCAGEGLEHYCLEPFLSDEGVKWRQGPDKTLDEKVLATTDKAFAADGGIRLLTGNLGRCVIKVSAVSEANRVVEAPIKVFDDQNDLVKACESGSMDRDVIAVVRFQGPKANGMPELHKLTPHLSNVQDKGYKVALITDGRMSGASGKVPAAIHLTPEALDGGPIGLLQDGDKVKLDANAQTLQVLIDDKTLQQRMLAKKQKQSDQFGLGRELFHHMRKTVNSAELGASIFDFSEKEVTME
ncbi:MAG: phosphogluconate dehydratase [Pseudomonadota bacterium]